MSVEVEIRFSLNGDELRATVPAHRSLLAMLREDFALTSPRLGCGEGECGACTVMIGGQARAACLVLAVEVDGAEVETAECLRRSDGSLAAVPTALVRAGAVQCGFCMPGIAVTATALLRQKRGPLERREIERALEGNLCRCTGYTKAIDAIEAASREEERS